jgi:RimJ/RimL family protein N-acetyltransferase
MAPLTLLTANLELRPLDAGDLAAWIARDPERLLGRTGARFQVPVQTPPLFGDDLPAIHNMLQRQGDHPGDWLWLMILEGTREPAGVVGFSTATGPTGTITAGWSVYPRLQGRGLATEALRALVPWALARPGVRSLRATIPPDNGPSIRVAEKLGMSQTGKEMDLEVGEVLVYELQATPP